MKPQIKLEFVISAKENKKLQGILAIPRISRNGNLYLPEELAKAHGKTVPVLWNHEGSPKNAGEPVNQSDVIGTMRLSWDPDLMQLNYEAEVERELPETPLHTSLGAFFEREDHVCGNARCYSIPRGLRFVEASLTSTPGIPETTVKIIENFSCRQCRVSSLTSGASNQCTMSSNDKEYITGTQFQEGIKSIVNAIGEHFKSAQQAQLEKLAEVLGTKPAPSSMVDDSARRASKESHDRVIEFFQRVKENPKDAGFPAVSWNVDKNEYLERWGYRAGGAKTEAVTISAGDMGQFFSKQVLVVPGGRMKTPVRQYCAYEEIPAGNDRAHFYTIGAFDFGAITEGTEPTNVAQTVSKKTATPSIRGAVQRVGYSQIESTPFALVDAINQAMVMAAIDDEATDLLSTTYDAVSPTNWVRADTGAAITSDDVASLTFKREGLLAAKRLIAQQGYDVSPGNLVLFIHPKAYQELLLDSNLNNFYQYARPDVTATGMLEQLYGIDIVIADQVKAQDNTTNDTYRNVLAVKGVAFGMASARNVAMEAQRRNEVQQVIVSGTHRVKSVVVDETASCRISSAQ
ncbi:hypothetical protein [Nitrososphaera sp.]|uniref:hypothetical protein n=1 Tax=Nitrososphaera sp. TaxID=1971748 RepID=UPI0017E786D2|nr:hypothetical protein [Nitrososphaera sp.]NWG38087.1 hypothetical protein [Nitrososphaera sp.]